ncbi:hypothetical protein E1A91_A10G054000v1 [Gossypium mustelinum]|uniref:Uncharacterized protein n=1 Tax=Gossypium mustelinum TaxID=34275 RepID=A0A5D2XHI7_GOSMU|nr:hypothetical protein E1A91_A10G054000v1 [Gossypium mustelinum]
MTYKTREKGRPSLPFSFGWGFESPNATDTKPEPDRRKSIHEESRSRDGVGRRRGMLERCAARVVATAHRTLLLQKCSFAASCK